MVRSQKRKREIATTVATDGITTRDGYAEANARIDALYQEIEDTGDPIAYRKLSALCQSLRIKMALSTHKMRMATRG